MGFLSGGEAEDVGGNAVLAGVETLDPCRTRAGGAVGLVGALTVGGGSEVDAAAEGDEGALLDELFGLGDLVGLVDGDDLGLGGGPYLAGAGRAVARRDRLGGPEGATAAEAVRVLVGGGGLHRVPLGAVVQVPP